jgi:WD40 repeat protein
MKTGALLETIAWSTKTENGDRETMIYASEFSKGANAYIAAGGSGANNNDIRLFNAEDGKCVAMIENCSAAFFAIAMSHNVRMLAAGGGSKTLYVYDIDPSVAVEFSY